MKKNILIYGVISGLIVSAIMFLSVGNITDFNTGLVVGYASMLIAFSLVYVGIKNYRDKYNGGVISFGKAFKIGIFIVLISSTIYVIAWLIDFNYFVPDYLEKNSIKVIDDLKAAGTSQIEIDNKAKEMADFAVLYKNPFL